MNSTRGGMRITPILDCAQGPLLLLSHSSPIVRNHAKHAKYRTADNPHECQEVDADPPAPAWASRGQTTSAWPRRRSGDPYSGRRTGAGRHWARCGR